MFGFLKRLVRRGSAAASAMHAAPSTASPPPSDTVPASAAEERPGKSWFASSLDLHDGLDVSDAEDERTEPAPLDERPRA